MRRCPAILRISLWVACSLAALTLAADPAFAADPLWIARSRTGMVAADSAEASRIGADVLAAGGNAFDAAVATSLALAVARPESTGLGGGGFLVAYLGGEKRFVVLDFRETAPAGATAERYAGLLKNQGDGPPPTIYGGNAVGVPGQAAGLAEILRRFGTRPWRELVAPAIALAEAGFAADEHYVDAAAHVLKDMAKWPALRERYTRAYETFLGRGTTPQVGDRITRTELARGLRVLAEGGPEAFYRGPLAEAVVRAVRAAGGVLTLEDLAAYKVRERAPLRAAWQGYEIVTMPPPSSGGICVVEALSVFKALGDLHNKMGMDWRRESAGYLVLALKHAFADRSRWLGDPDFTAVPVALLTDHAYAERLARRAKPNRPDDFGSVQLPPETGSQPAESRPAPGGGRTPNNGSTPGDPAGTFDDRGGPPGDRSTSHFCVADRDGNVVAMTETINGFFGSLVVAEPYGILLNNEMDDFTAEPGKPNLYGLVQGERNAIAPGKRPLSSMAPTIVLQGGRPVLVLGASGGPKIITAVVQVLLNTLEFGLPLDEAVAAVRLHHQWLPDEVVFDREPPAEVVKVLQEAGLTISPKRGWGVVEAIEFLPDGRMVGASDPRKGGRPAGER